MNQIPVTIENLNLQLKQLDTALEMNEHSKQNLLVLKAMRLEELMIEQDRLKNEVTAP